MNGVGNNLISEEIISLTMKKVLFLCVGNSCRSQMAEGFAKLYGSPFLKVTSAGTKPASSVNPKAVEVMKELGIDITGQQPKILTSEMIQDADVLISMGCGVEESCPADLYDNFVDWDLDDPYDQSIEKYREIRDEIKKLVKALVEEIGI